MRKNLKRTLSLFLALILLTVSVNTFTSYSVAANTQRNELVIPGNIENFENTSELELRIRISIGISFLFHYISPEYEDHHGIITFYKGSVGIGGINISPPSDMLLNSTIKFGGTTYNISDYQKVTFSEGLIKSPDLFLLCCSNTEEIVFPSTLSRLKVFSLQLCSNLQDIYFYNPDCDIPMDSYTIPQSATIHCYKNSTAHKYAQKYNRNYKFIGETFPDGYDFYEDSYNFKNYSDNISKKYFTTLFGNDKGKLLYKKKHNAGGLCFGFAYTTAAIYNGFPDISTIATRSGPVSVEICSCIRDIHHQWSDLINDGSALSVGDKILSIEDYIKYAYIYQFSKTVEDNRVWYNNDDTFLAGELLSLVKECTDNNDLYITIGMINKTGGGHLVLAVGYEGNDILVDDPNNTKDLERINVKSDGTWSFSGLDNWNSDTCYIISNTDISAPYSLLCSGQTVTVKESLISENVTRTESYVEGMNILDNDCNLISINSNTFSSKENLTKVVGTESNGSENEEDINLYWTDENVDKVTLNDIKGEDIEISMAGNESIISTKASSVDDVSIDVESPSIIVSADMNSTYDIVFENYSENDNFEENEIALSVSGTASSDTVTATQTETGLVVTGLSDGTVTLSKDDEVIETQEISNATSDIEITYDKTGESDDVSLDYDHSHTDSDADGKCDICGETLEAVKNCTHLCHKTGFLGFIWKIVNIFNKLFEINPVCSCGMKHY